MSPLGPRPYVAPSKVRLPSAMPSGMATDEKQLRIWFCNLQALGVKRCHHLQIVSTCITVEAAWDGFAGALDTTQRPVGGLAARYIMIHDIVYTYYSGWNGNSGLCKLQAWVGSLIGRKVLCPTFGVWAGDDWRFYWGRSLDASAIYYLHEELSISSSHLSLLSSRWTGVGVGDGIR
jgi:hypothetical protein